MADPAYCKNKPLDRAAIERASRIYASNIDASQALGITPNSFGRLCRNYGIETPKARRQREWALKREGRGPVD